MLCLKPWLKNPLIAKMFYEFKVYTTLQGLCQRESVDILCVILSSAELPFPPLSFVRVIMCIANRMFVYYR